MANTFTVRGTKSNNPCLVICYQIPYSYTTTAYAIEGSKDICFTYEEINEGVNVEDVENFDILTTSNPIEDEWELMEEVEGVMG